MACVSRERSASVNTAAVNALLAEDRAARVGERHARPQRIGNALQVLGRRAS
jgi:hypothetical protein